VNPRGGVRAQSWPVGSAGVRLVAETSWEASMRIVSAFVIVTVLASAACSSSSSDSAHPSTLAAAQSLGTALCPRLQSCFPSDFASKFPSGVSSCIQTGTTSASATTNDACLQSQINQCATDVTTEACGPDFTTMATSLPASCNGC
jgi:hypothetical protein